MGAYIPLKYLQMFNGIHSIVSQKAKLFMATAAIT
jgi:hypothetical protein